MNSENPSRNTIRKRIETELRRRLSERGLAEVAEKPDLNVRYSLGAANRRQVDVYPSGWGNRRYVVHH